jgi:choline-sulfatase
MIIFTADHGEHLGDYNCFGKRSMHDSCARIPLIINLPGKFDGGVVCEDAASLVDIAPTILGAADVNSPSPDHKMDGVDLFKLFTGEIKREYVFGQLSFYAMGMNFLEKDEEFSKQIQDKKKAISMFSTYMAASKDWKYFYSAPDNREFMFNKQTDPKETRNIISNQFCKEDKEKIKEALINHLKECGEIEGIEKDDWKPYKFPAFTKDPDQGLLIQDIYTPWTDTYIPGYSD